MPVGEGLRGVALVLGGSSVLNEVVGGIADRETGAPCTAQTRFQVASVSKQFTAAAVLLLAERGRLRLDDPGYYHPGDNPGYQSFNGRLHDPAVRVAVLTNDETTDLRTVVADLVELECGGR